MDKYFFSILLSTTYQDSQNGEMLSFKASKNILY